MNDTTPSVEEEQLYDNEEQVPEIREPFDPNNVDIVTQPMVISNLTDRMYYGDIDLNPDYQRYAGIWSDQKQSRLIESLIVRIPLPSFYFDAPEHDKLIVVDGLQRLWALKRFMVLPKDDPDKLKLTGLEYLTQYNGKMYEELPISIQRRIREQTITAYVIRPGTPDRVRTSIFTRINTGGATLKAMEIRNSVYRGRPAQLLLELAESEEFLEATHHRVSPRRMQDRELVNRFLAFYILGFLNYGGNYEEFLQDVLEKIKDCSEKDLDRYRKAFKDSMNLSRELLEDRAFRNLSQKGKYGAVNKALFETTAVTFASLNDEERIRLAEAKTEFNQRYSMLLKDKAFSEAITSGTGKTNSVRTRHQKMLEVVKGVIDR